MRRALWLLVGCLALLAQLRSAAAVDYLADVKPILRQHCYSCHGALRQKGSLRLDHVSFLREGGDSGPAVAESPEESLLLAAVTGNGDIERMPLESKPLSDEQIATLGAWIEAGAPAPEEPLPDDPRGHWSFQPPRRPALPEINAAEWRANPVDRFLAAEHEARGLKPSPAAAKNVLLRRVYLDLVGVPPSPADLKAFIEDAAPDAYEQVVDRLLASPQYGERWGRHWMDVWRYSDWDGYQAEVRESQPHIWRWRDWIIESLNEDKPYDEMIVEMLAADELKPEDPQALRASGFLVRNWYKFNRNVWLEATVEHTPKAFLGITLNCARCHDHMYDPISQEDYYRFRAIFEPHKVRTDRVAGQSDVKKDGLVRAYDADLNQPTYLYVRGNEAQPNKEHPLAPGVPPALGGDPVEFKPIELPPTAYYPGLREFVRQEALSAAEAELSRSEAAVLAATQALAAAREKANAKPAEAKSESQDSPADAEALRAAVTKAEAAAALAEAEMLAASAKLATLRAKIAADNAAFATGSASTGPAANAQDLAREANRTERIANVQQNRLQVLRLEQELAQATQEKKKTTEIEKQLAEARKAHATSQAALGQPGESFTRLSEVYPATSTGRRAALARWIASKNNPLTARVAINHIWLRHFGAPLVPTVFDFGLNGKPPTHPALLDWLAMELMENGWRMKAIHRLLVTSRAYQMQSAGGEAANLASDPENVYLWRMNPRRMEAEAVRDSTLAVADGLDGKMFGPELEHNLGLTLPRRSLYFRSSKEKKVTFLEMFDSPNVTDCYRRSETIVPQQALAMVNSSLSLAQARRLAGALSERLQGPMEGTHEAFVAAAFERVLCRPPTAEEASTCLEFLTAQAARFADPSKLAAFTSGGECEIKPSADPAQRARENLVHVLLNHNDFLTIR